MNLSDLGAIQTAYPGRLISLYDVLRFHAHKFIELARLMAEIRKELAITIDKGQTRVPETGASRITAGFGALAQSFRDVGLFVSEATLNRVVSHFKAGSHINKDTINSIESLENVMIDELGQKIIYLIPQEKSKHLNEEAPFGSDVLSNFSSATHDIAEAGHCYAVGRNTACVFHCIRVLELGLNALAVSLGISYPIENKRSWGKILTPMREQIELRSKSKELVWKVRTPLLENAYTFLVAAKNAWRDDTMHVAAKYDEQEAERIRGATKSFMQELSKLIDEKGKFLKP